MFPYINFLINCVPLPDLFKDISYYQFGIYIQGICDFYRRFRNYKYIANLFFDENLSYDILYTVCVVYFNLHDFVLFLFDSNFIYHNPGVVSFLTST